MNCMALVIKLIIVTECCGVNVVVFVSSDHLTEHTPVNSVETRAGTKLRMLRGFEG